MYVRIFLTNHWMNLKIFFLLFMWTREDFETTCTWQFRLKLKKSKDLIWFLFNLIPLIQYIAYTWWHILICSASLVTRTQKLKIHFPSFVVTALLLLCNIIVWSLPSNMPSTFLYSEVTFYLFNFFLIIHFFLFNDMLQATQVFKM